MGILMVGTRTKTRFFFSKRRLPRRKLALNGWWSQMSTNACQLTLNSRCRPIANRGYYPQCQQVTAAIAHCQ